jgi:hypothetical protein
MNEFNSRIAAQRAILKTVNAAGWTKEELLALSTKSIARWLTANQIDSDCRLARLLMLASKRLFFLANKSQEQVSEEYRLASAEIAGLLRAIEAEVSQRRQQPAAL